jgi:hypothetical protein
VIDFLRECPLEVPTEFSSATDGTYRTVFAYKNKEFADAWVKYHAEHAILRVLCKTCNLKRPNYEPKDNLF